MLALVQISDLALYGKTFHRATQPQTPRGICVRLSLHDKGALVGNGLGNNHQHRGLQELVTEGRSKREDDNELHDSIGMGPSSSVPGNIRC